MSVGGRQCGGRNKEERQMTERKGPGLDAQSVFFISFLLEWPREEEEAKAPAFRRHTWAAQPPRHEGISHTGVIGSQQAKPGSENERLSIKNGPDNISGPNLHFIDDNLKPREGMGCARGHSVTSRTERRTGLSCFSG